MYVFALIGGDGCAAVLDDSAPPVAVPSGTLLLVSPEHHLDLVWGSTCGWRAWTLDASLVRRAAVRAGLDRLVGLQVAALIDDGRIHALTTALTFESKYAHPLQRSRVQSLADALPRERVSRKWYRDRTRSRDARGRHAA
jgi:hypothetical protein